MLGAWSTPPAHAAYGEDDRRGPPARPAAQQLAVHHFGVLDVGQPGVAAEAMVLRGQVPEALSPAHLLRAVLDRLVQTGRHREDLTGCLRRAVLSGRQAAAAIAG